jgi:hypothetical protein
MFDDGPSYGTPGDLFITRLWQGKVILLCVVVPVLLTVALNYVAKPTRRRLGWVLLAGVAAVGMTTTATFLVPIVALGAMAPLVVRGRLREAALGFVAMAGYSIAAGVVTVAVGGHSADDFGSRELFRFDPEWFGHAIFLNGVIAFLVVGCVLVGALLQPRTDARITTAVLVLITGITFIPGFTDITYDVLGLGPTLWRVSWVCAIAGLVGLVGTAASRPGGSAPNSVRYGVPIAMAAALMISGSPIWTSGADVSRKAPWDWQRDEYSVPTANALIPLLRTGDLVLAPGGLTVTIAVSTTRVKTVAPRDYIMDYLKDEPGFHYQDRLTLLEFVDLEEDLPFDAEAVRAALNTVRPDTVCIYRGMPDRELFLQSAGYKQSVRNKSFACYDRPSF